MYLVTGVLETTRAPEAIVGAHGFFHEKLFQNRDTSEFGMKQIGAFGPVHLIAKAANTLANRGLIPDDTHIERIESLDQAQKYGGLVVSTNVVIPTFRRPDVPSFMRKITPDSDELVGAKLVLWQRVVRLTPRGFALDLPISKVQFRQESGREQESGWKVEDIPYSPANEHAGKLRWPLHRRMFELAIGKRTIVRGSSS